MASVALMWFISIASVFLSVFWLHVFFRKEDKRMHGLKEFPRVSIIVPAYNEAKGLADCLKALLNLEYPRENLEIIVVNDGSTDNTKEIAASFIKEGVILVNKKNGGKGSALNAGLRKATGDFVSCMDADSVTERNTLKKLIREFQDGRVAAVTAAMKVRNPKNLIQRLQSIEYVLAIFLRYMMDRIETIQVTPGPFSIYRKSILDKIGYFDESSIVEDTEIAYRIHHNGYKIRNVVDAYVYTSCPDTLASLKNQRVRWYRGLYRTTKQYRAMIFSREYGNFGIFQLPMMTFSIFLLILAFYLYASSFLEYLTRQISIVGLVGLEYYIPVMKDLFTFHPLSFNVITAFPIIVTFSIGFYLLKLAYDISKEKIFSKAIYIVPYVLIYYSFLAIFWLIALTKEMRGEKTKW